MNLPRRSVNLWDRKNGEYIGKILAYLWQRDRAVLPRILATVLLITSIVMLAPIGAAVIAMAGGTAVPMQSWAIPMVILAIGSLLIWMLSRKNISLNLYLIAFALWIVTAGYFVVRYLRMP